MPMENCALLVIDVQVGVFEWGDTEIHESEALLQNLADLIRTARETGVPVIFIQHCESSGGLLAKGAPTWEFHPSVSPEASDAVLLKEQSSAFEQTRLAELLSQRGIQTLIACGLQSEYCVSNSCSSALAEGFDVVVAKDAHSTRSTEEEEASEIIARQNAELTRLGAQVLLSSEIQQLLRKGPAD